MPEVSEIRKAKGIGKRGTHKYIWSACLDCGKERWIGLRDGIPVSKLCKGCSSPKNSPHLWGALNPLWKGGISITGNGYIRLKLYPDDFFFPMANKKGYVLEHRLVVAKALARCLLPWEVVHHKEGYAKDDNRYPETLDLITDKRFHLVDTMVKAYIKRLEKQVEEHSKRITLLEAENVLLSQIRGATSIVLEPEKETK